MGAFNSLDLRQAEIVRMYVEEKLRPSVIADRVGCQPPAIRRRLKAAGVFVAVPKRTNKGPSKRVHHTNSGRPVYVPDEVMSAPREVRTVCPRCQVRSDVGCRHSGSPPLIAGTFGL